MYQKEERYDPNFENLKLQIQKELEERFKNPDRA
jgi:hypothetical protein